MHLKTTHRRTLCFRRWLQKAVIFPAKHRHFQGCPGCARRTETIIIGVAAAMLTWALIGSLSTKAAQQGYTIPHPAPVKQSHDTGERTSKLPIAYSDDTITLSFHDCRENEKHHWSCRLTDGEGDTDHYVYLPGIHPTERKVAP